MGTIHEQLVISAPPERVWNAVIDFEARPRWEPRVKEARVLGGKPLQEGSRIRIRVDRNRFTASVEQIRPPERLVLLVKGPGFRVRHIYELKASVHETVITMTGDYRGVIGSLMTHFMRGSVRRDLADELTAIKRAAEALRRT